MKSVLSKNIWLRRFEGKVAISNLLTGRRTLLEPGEIDCLEPYCRNGSGQEPPESKTLNFLKEADILVPTDQASLEADRLATSLVAAVDKFISEKRGTSRRKVGEQVPNPEERFQLGLELAKEALVEQHDEFGTDLENIFEHSINFYHQEVSSDRGFQHDLEFLKRCWGRPNLSDKYAQLPCLPETTQRRVDLGVTGSASNCLVLGDDDLVSLLWAIQSDSEVHTFELDPRLVDFLESQSLENLKVFQRDLAEGLPEEHRGKYDRIYSDPTYTRKEMDMFLKCCAQGLSQSDGARVFLTTRPQLIEDGAQLPERLESLGLSIVAQHKNFSRYPLPQHVRSLTLQKLKTSGISRHLLISLLQVPFYYADMLELKRLE